MPTLQNHPATPTTAVSRIEADASRSARGELTLRYVLTGDIAALNLPEKKPSVRTDELWTHTCFEAFVRAESAENYFEFNLSPSTEWAAWSFTSTRTDMAAVAFAVPHIRVSQDLRTLTLETTLALDSLPGLGPEATWRLGLSAVIEETSGRKSYWALAHPGSKPNFHHRDCFQFRLPAA